MNFNIVQKQRVFDLRYIVIECLYQYQSVTLFVCKYKNLLISIKNKWQALVHHSCQMEFLRVVTLCSISSIFLMGLERFIPGIECTMRQGKKKAKAAKNANNK